MRKFIRGIGAAALAATTVLGIGFVGAGSASAAAQDYGCTLTGVASTKSASYGSANLHYVTGGTLTGPYALPVYWGQPCTTLFPAFADDRTVIYSLTAAPGKTIGAYAWDGGNPRAFGVRLEFTGGQSFQSSSGTSSQGVTRAGSGRLSENIRIYNINPDGSLGNYFTLCDGTNGRLANVSSCL